MLCCCWLLHQTADAAHLIKKFKIFASHFQFNFIIQYIAKEKSGDVYSWKCHNNWLTKQQNIILCIFYNLVYAMLYIGCELPDTKIITRKILILNIRKNLLVCQLPIITIFMNKHNFILFDVHFNREIFFFLENLIVCIYAMLNIIHIYWW